MFFLAPIIGSICSAAAGIGTSAIAAGSAVGSSALAAGSAIGSSALAAGGTLAATGKALATGSTLAAAGRTLASGAKVLTLEEAAKYAGAAYIGAQIAKHRQRKPEDQQPDKQNQGCQVRRPLYYVQTAEGLVPVYGEP